MKTHRIPWTDWTWNAAVGCSRVSAGCDHCYAIAMAARNMTLSHVGLTKIRPKDAARPGVDWTGEVRKIPGRLLLPTRMKKPKRIFVDSMFDVFHAGLPFEYVAAIFAVMAVTPHHYQVVTKRPERWLEFDEWITRGDGALTDGSVAGDCADYLMRELGELPLWIMVKALAPKWPLPNVHCIVSVEDQGTADSRIPIALQVPAAIHGVSYEPALGPVEFKPWLRDPKEPGRSALDWIIVGGESGRFARPFELDWADSTVQAGKRSGTAIFVKQLGACASDPKNGIAGKALKVPPEAQQLISRRLVDAKGADIMEWPERLRVQQFPTDPHGLAARLQADLVIENLIKGAP